MKLANDVPRWLAAVRQRGHWSAPDDRVLRRRKMLGRKVSRCALLCCASLAAYRGHLLRCAALLIAVLWCVVFGVQGAEANADSEKPAVDAIKPQIVSVEAGFKGLFKTGFWTPYRITIRGGVQPIVAQMELTVWDGDNVATTAVVPRPLHIPAGKVLNVVGYAKPGRSAEEVIVSLRSPTGEGGELLARRSIKLESLGPLPDGNQIILGVGASVGLASTVELINRATQSSIGAQAYAVQLDSFEGLPTRWYGYEGIDWLVVGINDPALYRGMSASDARFQAIERWVDRGGRLVLMVGSEASEALAPESPWKRFVPGRFEEMVTLGVFSAVEAYSGSSVPVATGRQRVAAEVPRLVEVRRGMVEAREGNLPLIVRRSYGFGQVVFVGLDLDRLPWLKWPARDRLIARLLGYDVDNLAESDRAADAWGMVRSAGFDDLSGKLRTVLERFSGVKVVPFWLVACLVFAYILWIGPIDYLLVKRIFRRMELTWVTFPTAVVLISVGAFALGHYMKGDALLVNTIDLFDVDMESGLVRGTHWSNVFSPQVGTYTIEVRPLLPDGKPTEGEKRLLSWLGLPGFGVGGLQSPTADAIPWSVGYRYAAGLDQLLDVPIQVWSTKSFVQRWSMRDFDIRPTLDIELREQGGFLEGRITNRLDVALDKTLLAFGRWAYRLGSIAPGQTVTIDPLRDPRTLEAELSRYAFSDNGNSPDQLKVYDVFAIDAIELIRQMTFYRAGGGRQFAQFHHRYQAFVDLSSHLGLGRAVLIGFLDRPGAEVRIDGKKQSNARNRHTTCLRVVIPLYEDNGNAATGGESPVDELSEHSEAPEESTSETENTGD